MTKIKGRVLDPPSLSYSTGQNERIEVKPRGGKWTMEDANRRKGAFIKPQVLKNWGILILEAGRPDRYLKENMTPFLENLKKEAQKSGLTINPHCAQRTVPSDRNMTDIETKFCQLYDEIDAKCGAKPELIMCFCNGRGAHYERVKLLGDIVKLMPTQFVLTKNVNKMQPQTLHNICTNGSQHLEPSVGKPMQKKKKFTHDLSRGTDALAAAN